MQAVSSQELGKRICEHLGLDSGQVTFIALVLEADGPVVLNISMVATPDLAEIVEHEVTDHMFVMVEAEDAVGPQEDSEPSPPDFAVEHEHASDGA